MTLYRQKGASATPDDAKTVQGLQVVKLIDAYTPITVKDQFGNDYICLNWYEANAVRDLIETLQPKTHMYDTGDWWRDLPKKIHEWQYQVNDLASKKVKDVSEPLKSDSGTREEQ